jgi:hypothetical protein
LQTKEACFIGAQNVANIGRPHILHGFINHYCQGFVLQYNLQQHDHNRIIATLFSCSCCSCPSAIIAIAIAIAPLQLTD